MIKLKPKDGWIVNTNPKVVSAIMRGLERCQGECPCHNTSRDKQCPCSDYIELDVCHCGLYVKDESHPTRDTR